MNLLADVFGRLLSILEVMIPRVSERPPKTMNAVYDTFLFGEQIVNWRPVLYVPVGTHREAWPRTYQYGSVEDLTPSSADGVAFQIGGEFCFTVDDPIVCRNTLGDEYESALCAMVAKEIVKYVRTAVASAVIVDSWDEDVLEACQPRFEECGCSIHEWVTEECCEVMAIRHFGSPR